jgi:hypothetical protein
MYWRLCKNTTKDYPCLICNETISKGQEYIRPHFGSSAGGLHKPISSPHKTTWKQQRPYFHPDCLENIRGWFESKVTVYQVKNNKRQNIPVNFKRQGQPNKRASIKP